MKKNSKLYEFGSVESLGLFWLCLEQGLVRAQRGWTLITTKMHIIFGTYHKQMDCFWKLARMIQLLGYNTVWYPLWWMVSRLCTQEYVEAVINLIV